MTVYHQLSPWIQEAGVTVTVVDERESFLVKPSLPEVADVRKLATAWDRLAKSPSCLTIYILRKKGIREKSPITCYTPGSVFFDDVGDNVHRAFGELAAKQDVQVLTNKTIERIERDRVHFADGTSVASALTVMVPTYRGPQVVVDAGLGDEAGFVPTDENFRHLDLALPHFWCNVTTPAIYTLLSQWG